MRGRGGRGGGGGQEIPAGGAPAPLQREGAQRHRTAGAVWPAGRCVCSHYLPLFLALSCSHTHTHPLAHRSITTLYVGGVTPEVTEADLRDAFYSFGEIASMRKVKAIGSGRSVGAGVASLAGPRLVAM